MNELGVNQLFESEVTTIRDLALIELVRELQVKPYLVERDWDYGAPGQRYSCWTVLEHRSSNTGVAYCGQGFGPTFPWGLVFLSGPPMGMGMDCNWYSNLGDAVRESVAWQGDNPPGYEVN
ncbi:hypothetical protein Pla175_48440 [Pirellulimonas nuda]|uniref:Uncharacterized protein n=1 Tax=Pirellulimonas nuda TaxID=2528009 RepID=A0A518DIW1_9BACT|nr:hypothetical protein Pla175_48440 [Pirellulimonas nuda]